jgi:hypothetical protein
MGISVGCAVCQIDKFNCANSICKDACQNGEGCDECQEIECLPAYTECTNHGVLPTAGVCPDATELFCDGTCWPPAWWTPKLGDNKCDPETDCEEYNFDGSDCQNGEGGGVEGGQISTGTCTNQEDQAALDAVGGPSGMLSTCAQECGNASDPPACSESCIGDLGLSDECTECSLLFFSCIAEMCIEYCPGTTCPGCVQSECMPDFMECGGFGG